MNMSFLMIFLLALTNHNFEVKKEFIKGQSQSVNNSNFDQEYYYDSTQPPSLTNLPPEILKEIIGKLGIKDIYNIMLVCHVLRDLGQSCNPTFNIHNYKFYFGHTNQKKELTSKILIKLLKRFSNLIEINLGDVSAFFSKYTNDKVLKTIKNCRNLRKLNLKNCRKITDDGLAYIAYGCNLLQKINLSGCKNISDEGLAILSRGCRRLQYLELNFCYNNITKTGLHYLLENCPDLNTIKLEYCNQIYDSDLEYIGQFCNVNLQEIDIYFSETITNDGLIHLLRMCPNLKKIRFSLMKNLTDRTIFFLLENCPNVEYLEFMGCDLTPEAKALIAKKLPATMLDYNRFAINDKILMDIRGHTHSNMNHEYLNNYNYDPTQSPNLNNLPPEILAKIIDELDIKDTYNLMLVSKLFKDLIQNRIPSLDINNYKYYFDNVSKKKKLTSRILIKLINRFPNLIKINLGSNIRYTREYVGDSVLGSIKDCRNLRELNLENCQKITDNGLSHIAQGCNLLKKLNLYGCKKISDLGLALIAQRCPNLQDIELDFTDRLTNIGLQYLIENCRNLKKINFWNCSSLYDSDLLALGQLCGELQEIDFFESETITDNGVINLLKMCPNLKRIKFFGFRNITNRAIIFLIYNCSNLEFLDIRGCDLITQEAVDLIKTKLPEQMISNPRIFAITHDKLFEK
ncbi:F-box-like domain-containing protein [Candidatus Babeliales bacterium]|nr:F-box-like domain-containing protein [Candidatus Babeliales bacterium]